MSWSILWDKKSGCELHILFAYSGKYAKIIVPGVLCNGSTPDFESVCRGSNPCTPAK